MKCKATHCTETTSSFFQETVCVHYCREHHHQYCIPFPFEVGQKVKIETTGTIVSISHSHGFCIEVELDKRDFSVPRKIWLDKDEFSKGKI